MAAPAKQRASYSDLYGIPENMVGEIFDGELIVTPRPSYEHSHVEFALSSKLGPPFRFAEGGPGGWILLIEPEILLGADLLVPDMAGWRRERLQGTPRENWTSVAPDWVCEILSPRTARVDRVRKMPIYARHAVGHIWLIDPTLKTLEVFRLESGRWSLLASFADTDRVRAEPFHEVEIDLASLWMDD
jgi:Uma2 family endonuclease